MKKYLLGIIAIVLAVGFSAFTIQKQKSTTQYVWFTVVDGTMDTHNGILSANPPTGCTLTTGTLCARAFDEDDATSNGGGSGTYSLNSGVDPVDDAIFEKFKSE